MKPLDCWDRGSSPAKCMDMFVCCVGSGLCDELITGSGESGCVCVWCVFVVCVCVYVSVCVWCVSVCVCLCVCVSVCVWCVSVCVTVCLCVSARGVCVCVSLCECVWCVSVCV